MKKWLFLLLSFFVIAVIFWQQTETISTTHVDDEIRNEMKNNEVDTKEVRDEAVTQTSRIPSPKARPSLVDTSNRTLAPDIRARFGDKTRGPSSIERYFEDGEINLDGQHYLISESLRTLPLSQYELGDGTEVLRLSGYVFFESSSNARGEPALYLPNNKSPVILTGRVLLKNISADQAREIATRMQVRLDTSMSHLGVYAFQAPQGALEAVETIGNSLSTVEIVEGQIHEK